MDTFSIFICTAIIQFAILIVIIYKIHSLNKKNTKAFLDLCSSIIKKEEIIKIYNETIQKINHRLYLLYNPDDTLEDINVYKKKVKNLKYKKVLIIDGSNSIVSHTIEKLAKIGIQCNSIETDEIYSQKINTIENYDFILISDLNESSKFDIWNDLKDINIPIFIYSSDEIPKSWLVRTNGCISKPIRYKDLFEILENYFNKIT